MKNLKQLPWLVLLLVLVTLFSCNNDETFDNIEPTSVNNEFMVNEATARNIANNLLLGTTTSHSKSQKNTTKSKKVVKSILEVPDKNKKAAYFIINYTGGGFVILAGDKRSEPILAFSETNEFDLKADYYPAGLVDWLYSAKEGIEVIRMSKGKSNATIETQWSNLQQSETDLTSYRIDPEGPKCDDPYYITKGPFLQTNWGQGCGYNAQTPSISCSAHCNHALTGCVATAMAQVMKYHQFPSNYNWSSMPNSSGSGMTATLMRNVGNAVNMDYGCDGSGTNTRNEVASSFTNDFGYSSASYDSYNYQVVKSELNNSRPVILKGGRKSGWWIFSQYKNGHAWVCDGYSNYVDPCSSSTLRLHMNWGWNGYYNGWYSFNNFNPGDNSFNYRKGMVYNIRP